MSVGRCARSRDADPERACGECKTRRPRNLSLRRNFEAAEEARGIPREQVAALGAKTYAIKGAGVIESLNLAATVNMCVYELNRVRN